MYTTTVTVYTRSLQMWSWWPNFLSSCGRSHEPQHQPVTDHLPAHTHKHIHRDWESLSLSLSLTHTHIQPQPIPHTDTICYIPNNPVLDTVHSNPYHPKLSTCTLQLHLYSVLLLMQSPHRLCFPTREFFMGSFSCSSWGKHNETGSCYLANSF